MLINVVSSVVIQDITSDTVAFPGSVTTYARWLYSKQFGVKLPKEAFSSKTGKQK